MDKPSDANSAANFDVSWPKARPFGLGRFTCKRQRLVTTTFHYANDNHLYAERFDCFTQLSERISFLIYRNRSADMLLDFAEALWSTVGACSSYLEYSTNTGRHC